MNKVKIENALLAMGIKARTKGFNYIVDAIEMIDENENIGITKGLYPKIAEKRNVSTTSVERAIRHTFNTVRGEKGDYEYVNYYIGFINCGGGASLRQLHMLLKRESEEETSI